MFGAVATSIFRRRAESGFWTRRATHRGDGVLVLSEFAGAARELADALIINPYDIEQFADAIRQGLEMSANERHARMRKLTRQVEEHNIYRWAARLLTQLAATQATGSEKTSGSKTAAS